MQPLSPTKLFNSRFTKLKYKFDNERAPHLFINAAFLFGTSSFRYDPDLKRMVYETSGFHRIRHFLSVSLHVCFTLFLQFYFIRDYGWRIEFNPSNNVDIMRAVATLGHTIAAGLNTNTIWKSHEMLQFLNGFDELCSSVDKNFNADADADISARSSKKKKVWMGKIMKLQVVLVFVIPLLTLSDFVSHCDRNVVAPILQTCLNYSDSDGVIRLTHGSTAGMIWFGIIQVSTDIATLCAALAYFPFIDDTFIRGPRTLQKL